MVNETSPVDGNGLTKYKVEELLKNVSDLQKRIETLEKDLIESRLERERIIATTKANLDKDLNDIKEDVNDVKVDLATIGTRLTLFQGAQAVFTTIAGVVASIVGIIVK